MKAHIVLAHPEPKSFNGQLVEISRRVLGDAGWETTLSDLYAMDFDAREGPAHFSTRKNADAFHVQTEQRHGVDTDALPEVVATEIRRLEASDLLVVHFPLWWFGMPAILKGWMDRVFVYGRMYSSAKRYDAGVQAGKRVIACVTTGAGAEACAHNGREGDVHLHLWPLLYPYRYLGYDVLEPEVLHGVGGVAFIEGRESGDSLLDTYARRWTEALADIERRASVPYNGADDFDETPRLKPGAPVHSPFIRHWPDPSAAPDR